MLEKFEGEKKKQLAILTGVIAGGGALIFLLSELTKPEPQKIEETPKVKIIDEKKVQEETFKKIYGKKLLELQQEIERLKAENQFLKESLSRKLEESKNIPPPPPITSQSGRTRINISSSEIPPPPPNPNVSSQYLSQQTPPKPKKEFLKDVIAIDVEKEKEETQEIVESPEEGKKEKEKQFYVQNSIIPAGSFVKGILLSGVDAPTGGFGKKNPVYVLIKLVDYSVLPNEFRMNVKNCFVLGQAYGELSSERVHIRLERLSCIRNDGKILYSEVEGYVAGEDGKIGLLGRVVTKQGQMLARALVAGFLEGISKAFSQSSTVVSISPQGAVQTIKPENAFKVGIFSGASKATEKLADFYMKLANEMFPVIEVNAGRVVDIVFIKNVFLEGEKG